MKGYDVTLYFLFCHMTGKTPKTRVLFIDQDGTLVHDPKDNYQLDSWVKLRFMPGVFTWLGRIAAELHYELVLVSNQDGLGGRDFPEDPFTNIHNHLLQSLAGEGVIFSEVFIDRSFPHEGLPTRKPGTAMLKNYLDNPAYDLPGSFVIGDRVTDIQLAANLGAKGIFLKTPHGYMMSEEDWAELEKGKPAFIAENWKDVYYFLCEQERT